MYSFKSKTAVKATVPVFFSEQVFGLKEISLTINGKQTIDGPHELVSVLWFDGSAQHKVRVRAEWIHNLETFRSEAKHRARARKWSD